ncbi:GTP cyclohydrolase II [Ketogulonicigenium vulgare Y25]|uniref:3,4-dihydroxy-2-butanone-4-phosphate synthase n=1 Tax=Ketogulonicigenium vulgare TaxID=92945 RepID=UPI0001E66CE7|nr:3,4-dihydroxy-2-butanone-4-phosphate synthase [Ketogulonicigenium vulgare]ADO41808.1 GTP cyclohydrolase II [Ketogulonicigenium vulgare Y25]
MSLHDAITALQAGRMIILTDDESRENEGDLILPAQFATPEAINFMAMHGRGLICLALTGAQVDRLGLPPMVGVNRANRSTAFTVSVEARVGITTGISAADRATTMRLAAAPDVRAGDIVSPGHVFPLRAAAGGVLARDGHTEGGTDLMRLAGLHDGAVICEIMRDDGQMARADDLQAFAARHDLPIISIHDIAEHRLRHENLLDQVAQTVLPTVHGRFQTHAFRSQLDGQEHLALVNGGESIWHWSTAAMTSRWCGCIRNA